MAVALGFALPLSTSIYTQQQQNSAQQLQEQQAAQSRLQAALDRDRGFAVELSTQLRTERLRLNMSPHDGAAIRSPLCELLGHEVQMASDGAYGRYTLGVLVSAFRAPATASSSRTLCECRREGADLLALLKSRQSPLARTIAQRELRPLAAQLGTKVPLEADRGYHVMFPGQEFGLRRAVISQDRGVAIADMHDGIRASGVSEIAAPDAPADMRIADRLQRHAMALIPALRGEPVSRWMGHRPSHPDSKPVLGRSPHHRNVLFAFGHDHLGLTMAGITGKLVAELATDRPTTVDLAAYRPDRF
ncbi:MAG: FAD-binding oxidoreductase [Proteobacteria bacterium]|nr:FAD-binding oxidoreductase [Pseudomonadota bacterium]